MGSSKDQMWGGTGEMTRRMNGNQRLVEMGIPRTCQRSWGGGVSQESTGMTFGESPSSRNIEPIARQEPQ